MPLINDIQVWTETLPLWQRDAARRVFQSDKDLTRQDISELYELLKQENGIDVTNNIQPLPLSSDHLPQAIEEGNKVILKKLSHLENVNKILPNQTLKFNEEGITIIYGGNGSGKSGYARVMKLACRAREKVETIYPDVTNPDVSDLVPRANFLIETIEGEQQEVWSRDELSPEILSTISVFDSKCARSYLTDEKDVAYLPYGLDILEKLASSVLPKVSKLLDLEINSINTNKAQFLAFGSHTQVGKFIADSSYRTDVNEVKSLAFLSQEELERHKELELVLRETDPLEKIKQIKLSVQRLKIAANKVTEPCAWVTPSAVEKLRLLNNDKLEYEEAESNAAQILQSGDSLLSGTGNSTWKILFDSARGYSNDFAYTDKSFPELLEGDPCPLCQNPLSDASVERLKRFDAYINDDIAKKANLARKRLENATNKIASAGLQVSLDEPTMEELSNINPEIPEIILQFQSGIEEKRQWMLRGLETNEWLDEPGLTHNPRNEIRGYAAKKLREARALSLSTDESKRQKMQFEFNELDARLHFSNISEFFIGFIDGLKRKNALEKCRRDLQTRNISNQSKVFASKAITGELQSALNAEFKQLGVGHINTKIKERSSRGVMLHQLLLDLPSSYNVEEILSEGEQRSIAIGSFFAELSLANHSCGVIFDDPVSSLDHIRRKKIAKRLVKEASNRQVIIFTHEVVFLHQLQEECHKEGVEPVISYLERSGNYCGVVSEGLPWQHKTVAHRIDYLEKAQRRLERIPWPAYPTEDQAADIVRQYNFLRSTVERVVQDFVLNGTVQRFRDYIDVKRLDRVVGLEKNEVDEVFKLMQRCHDIVDSHDPASAKNDPPPSANEFGEDIERLKVLMLSISNRRNAS